jgi:hypothetical protein
MDRAIDLLLSFISALFAAMFLATIARDDMGMSVTAVRVDALSALAFCSSRSPRLRCSSAGNRPLAIDRPRRRAPEGI